MEDDPYAVLGVARDASPSDIRKAYRALAMQWHPDRHQDPVKQVEAEARFKKLSNAYEILGDPERRSQYDRGGMSRGFSTSSAPHDPFGTFHSAFSQSELHDFMRQFMSHSAFPAHDPGFAQAGFPSTGFFGQPAEQQFFSSSSSSSSSSMSDPFFGGGLFGNMGMPGMPSGFGFPSGGMTTFSSSSSFGGFGGGGGVSRSETTSIVNGRKQTVIVERDASGNETRTEIVNGVQTVYLNGQPTQPRIRN